MANTIVIQSLTPQGGDSMLATGTVNGVQSSANVSRSIIGSFATALLANQYVAFQLLHNCPQGVSQGAVQATTGTVNI